MLERLSLLPSLTTLLLMALTLKLGAAVTKSFVNSSMPDMRPTFVVNFDTGTVICQHSTQSDDLHLHQISILCDGKPDCYSNPAMHDESFPYCGERCNSTCNHRGACLFDGARGQCYCNAGYHGPQCELIDNNECEDKPCHWLAHCQNTYGSYSCTCYPGFQGDGHECYDIDECEAGLARCPEYSMCVNLPGTYFCNCTEGFQPLGLPVERCADIDECAQELHNCTEKLKCQNEIGSFKCVEKCDAGYRAVNDTVCVDIDECAEKISECDKRASCLNTVGGYQCKCEDGFTGDGKSCTPINDCSQQEGICDRHAFCIGTLRMCICQSGYVGDGLNCYDVNECAAQLNPCEGQIEAPRCVNIDGGYICCEEELDDEQCIRVKGAFCSGGCGMHAICYNETCQCMEGFDGDPRVKCSDINECENDKQCPGAGEWCVNMFGGHICCNPDSKEPECFRGTKIKNVAAAAAAADSYNFTGLGGDYDIHGIRRIISFGSIQQKSSSGFVVINGQVISTEQFGLACYFGCPADSHCSNGTCLCNDGFIGNTFDGCADVDECALGLCNEPDSWCINLRGSFACCTSNSTSSTCMGLEIIAGGAGDVRVPDGGLRIINAGTIRGVHRGLPFGDIMNTSDIAGSRTTVASGPVTRQGSLRTGGDTSGISSTGGGVGTHRRWKSGVVDSRKGTWSKGIRKGGWAIETVGEWKNFTGHAIIIGRGRIESGKWNVTRDKDGKLIGFEAHGNQTDGKQYITIISGNETLVKKVVEGSEPETRKTEGTQIKEEESRREEVRRKGSTEARAEPRKTGKTKTEESAVIGEGGTKVPATGPTEAESETFGTTEPSTLTKVSSPSKFGGEFKEKETGNLTGEGSSITRRTEETKRPETSESTTSRPEESGGTTETVRQKATSASSLSGSTFGEVHRITDEGTKKPEIIDFQSSKPSDHHQTTEELRKVSEVSAAISKHPKSSTVVASLESSGNSTPSVATSEIAAHSTDAKPVSESGLAESTKMEVAATSSTEKAGTAAVNGSTATPGISEVIKTTGAAEEKLTSLIEGSKVTTVISVPRSSAKEIPVTVTYAFSENAEIETHITDENIHNLSTEEQKASTMMASESVTPLTRPEAGEQRKSEGIEDQQRAGSTIPIVPGTTTVKLESATSVPSVSTAYPETASKASSVSVEIAHPEPKQFTKLFGKHTFGNTTTKPELGLEIVKVGVTAEQQTSGSKSKVTEEVETGSGTGETEVGNTKSVEHSEGVVRFTQSPLSSETTAESRSTTTYGSEVIRNATEGATASEKATGETAKGTEISAGESETTEKKIVSTTDNTAVSVKTSASLEARKPDTARPTKSSAVVSGPEAEAFSTKIRLYLPETPSSAQSTEAVSHDELSKTSVKWDSSTAALTETRTGTPEKPLVSEITEVHNETEILITDSSGSTKAETTSAGESLPTTTKSRNTTEESGKSSAPEGLGTTTQKVVTATGTDRDAGEAEAVEKGLTQGTASPAEREMLLETTAAITPSALIIEVEGSGEEAVIEFQNFSGSTGAANETKIISETVVLTDEKTQETGLEIMPTKAYPRTIESHTETASESHPKFTNSQPETTTTAESGGILKVSFTSVPESESKTDSAKATASLPGHNTSEASSTVAQEGSTSGKGGSKEGTLPSVGSENMEAVGTTEPSRVGTETTREAVVSLHQETTLSGIGTAESSAETSVAAARGTATSGEVTTETSKPNAEATEKSETTGTAEPSTEESISPENLKAGTGITGAQKSGSTIANATNAEITTVDEKLLILKGTEAITSEPEVIKLSTSSSLVSDSKLQLSSTTIMSTLAPTPESGTPGTTITFGPESVKELSAGISLYSGHSTGQFFTTAPEEFSSSAGDLVIKGGRITVEGKKQEAGLEVAREGRQSSPAAVSSSRQPESVSKIPEATTVSAESVVSTSEHTFVSKEPAEAATIPKDQLTSKQRTETSEAKTDNPGSPVTVPKTEIPSANITTATESSVSVSTTGLAYDARKSTSSATQPRTRFTGVATNLRTESRGVTTKPEIGSTGKAAKTDDSKKTTTIHVDAEKSISSTTAQSAELSATASESPAEKIGTTTVSEVSLSRETASTIPGSIKKTEISGNVSRLATTKKRIKETIEKESTVSGSAVTDTILKSTENTTKENVTESGSLIVRISEVTTKGKSSGLTGTSEKTRTKVGIPGLTTAGTASNSGPESKKETSAGSSSPGQTTSRPSSAPEPTSTLSGDLVIQGGKVGVNGTEHEVGLEIGHEINGSLPGTTEGARSAEGLEARESRGPKENETSGLVESATATVEQNRTSLEAEEQFGTKRPEETSAIPESASTTHTASSGTTERKEATTTSGILERTELVVSTVFGAGFSETTESGSTIATSTASEVLPEVSSGPDKTEAAVTSSMIPVTSGTTISKQEVSGIESIGASKSGSTKEPVASGSMMESEKVERPTTPRSISVKPEQVELRTKEFSALGSSKMATTARSSEATGETGSGEKAVATVPAAHGQTSKLFPSSGSSGSSPATAGEITAKPGSSTVIITNPESLPSLRAVAGGETAMSVTESLPSLRAVAGGVTTTAGEPTSIAAGDLVIQKGKITVKGPEHEAGSEVRHEGNRSSPGKTEETKITEGLGVRESEGPVEKENSGTVESTTAVVVVVSRTSLKAEEQLRTKKPEMATTEAATTGSELSSKLTTSRLVLPTATTESKSPWKPKTTGQVPAVRASMPTPKSSSVSDRIESSRTDRPSGFTEISSKVISVSGSRISETETAPQTTKHKEISVIEKTQSAVVGTISGEQQSTPSGLTVGPVRLPIEVTGATGPGSTINFEKLTTGNRRKPTHDAPEPSAVSSGGFNRVTQQETVSPRYATLLETKEQPKTTAKESYILKETTEATTAATEDEKQIVSLHCRSSDDCGSDAYCERRSGACRCYPGFDGQPPMTPCVDINECERHLDECDLTSRCSNKVGGYMCFCETGYRMSKDHVCVDINECLERAGRPCSSHATCTNLPGSYQCHCSPGYTGDGYTCIPVEMRHCTEEELAKADCGRDRLCLVDGNDQINCGTCKKGFLKEGTNCVDINECSEGNVCHEDAYCKNIMGSYSCHCQPGYKGDGFSCTDIDECQNNPCHPQAMCVNYPGSYSCKCPDGWAGDGKNECINPQDTSCLDRLAVCNRTNHTSCMSVNLGNLTSICECAANYRYNATKRTCEDIDECAENRHSCDPSNSICINTDGGYSCECAPGYEGTGGICVDVNECERGIAGCNVAARCENHLGSVGCKCAPGFTGDGIHCTATESLTKVESGCNEEWKKLCHAINKTCHIDDEDVPQCGSCLIGYQPSNGKCLPIHGAGNCADPEKNDCDVNAECIDVQPGRHFCTCKVGYIGDGRHCDDVDECSLPGVCDPAAHCRNSNGSFTCICQFGYTGNGFKCTPNKNKHGGPNCHLDVTMCHKNAECQLDGTCKCNPGYQGDGIDVCQLESGKQTTEEEKPTVSIPKVTGIVDENTKKSRLEETTTLSYDAAAGGSGAAGSPPGYAPPPNTEAKTKPRAEGVETTSANLTFETTKPEGRISGGITGTIGGSEIGYTSVPEEKEGKGTVTGSSGGTFPPGTFSVPSRIGGAEKDHTEVYEGSGEGELISKEWQKQHGSSEKATSVVVTPVETVPGTINKISGTTGVVSVELESGTAGKPTGIKATSSEMVSVHEGTSGVHSSTVNETLLSSSTWGYSPSPAPSSSFRGTVTIWKKSSIGGTISSDSWNQTHQAGERNCTVDDRSVCHEFADCSRKTGQCVCKPGYHGDGYTICIKNTEDCTLDSTVCDLRALCDTKTRTCKCIQGYIGDGIICAPDTFDCVLRPNLCSNFAECVGRRCVCNPGYTGDGTECVSVEPFRDCSQCDSKAKCHDGVCVCDKGYYGNGAICIADPEDCLHYPGLCNSNAICDPEKRRCICTRGYIGNGIECSLGALCANDARICDPNAECAVATGVCHCRQGFEGNGYHCSAIISKTGNETAAATQSYSSGCSQKCAANEQCRHGECQCADGYKRGLNGTCMDIDECTMGTHDCHTVAICTNIPGSFTCRCPDGYRGNGRKCAQHHNQQNMSVDCELDGMTLILANDTDLYDGRIFVRGQTENPFCSKKLNALLTNGSEYHFTIQYAHCSARFEEPDTIALTIVIQRHPMFITQTADAYDVRCTYPVGVRKVANHVGISEITTTKTIIETGTGPTCSLTVTNEQGEIIDTATVGQPLRLTLSVQPNDTYAVLPRNCFAINLETGELYSLTDQAGCAIDTELFPEWTHQRPSLATATFRTFKWPDSSMIRFQCDCSACVESCPKVNCAKRREAMKRRRLRYRYVRKTPEDSSLDEELERRIVKGPSWMAYSGALHINEEEELVRAQRDMERWKYQGLKTYEEPVDALMQSGDRICIRVFWIMLSLLPLLLMLAFVGLLLCVIWTRKSSGLKYHWRRTIGYYPPSVTTDSGSSYLKF